MNKLERNPLFARAPMQDMQVVEDDDRERLRADNCNTPLPPPPEPSPCRESMRGLDWFIFFLADVQTGFGPFVAVYLTTEKWTHAQMGCVLSIGGVIGLIGQIPGGAIVDAARSERLVAGLAVATIGFCALADAVLAVFPGGAGGGPPHSA